jgi:hypothetical protein
MTVTADRLTEAAAQLDLFASPAPRRDQTLQRALDRVRKLSAARSSPAVRNGRFLKPNHADQESTTFPVV